MNDIIIIFIIATIQAVYDYIGWKGIFKEQSGHKLEWLYRVVKETLDFPVTYFILHNLCNIEYETIIAFYSNKWVGLCDAIYIGIWKLFHWNENYTSEGIYWLWWTPLGVARIILDLKNNVDKWNILFRYKWDAKIKYFHKAGEMCLTEFQIQIAIGFVATVLYLYLF